jgi:hypothetical protein
VEQLPQLGIGDCRGVLPNTSQQCSIRVSFVGDQITQHLQHARHANRAVFTTQAALVFAKRSRRIDRESLMRSKQTRRESDAADHGDNSDHDERISGTHFEEQTGDHATDR